MGNQIWSIHNAKYSEMWTFYTPCVSVAVSGDFCREAARIGNVQSRSTPLRDQRQQSQTMRLSGQGRTIPTLHAWSKGRTDATLTRRLRSRTKGLFTWKWGTPGRWGNPPSCGRKTKRVYIQSYDPGVLGWGFMRLFISASRKNKPTHGLCSISRLGLLTRQKFKEFLNYFELNEPWTRYTTLLNATSAAIFFVVGGRISSLTSLIPPRAGLRPVRIRDKESARFARNPVQTPKNLFSTTRSCASWKY